MAATPPFPTNGPEADPEFDGHKLLLLKHATPPTMLEEHIGRLGAEIADGKLVKGEKGAGFEWPPPPGSELAAILSKEALLEWGYDLFKLNELSNGGPLSAIAHGIIYSHNLVERLNIDPSTLTRYLNALEQTYNACIYHNPMHASDVMHATNYLVSGQLAEDIPPEELLAVLLSGPAHDLGHPGVNNGYLIKRDHPTAKKYDKQSVLENHHIGLAITIMDLPGMNVLSCLPKEKGDHIRNMMREMVLYTDMSKHKGLMDMLEGAETKRGCLDMTRPEDRLLCMQALLHTADLGNPCKPWTIHIQWTHAIVAEFFSQGDMERSQGLDPSFMCDRNENCGRSPQKNFIINFCRPLFRVVGVIVPQTREKCALCVAQLDKNVARWSELGF